MSVEVNKNVVMQFIEYMELQDYEKLASLLSETFEWIIPARGEGMAHVPKVRDKPFTVQRIKANRDLMEHGMSLKPVGWTMQGDRVALEAEGTVTWNTGKVYNNLYHLLFVIRNGKIDRFVEYCDFLYAWETNPLLSQAKAKS